MSIQHLCYRVLPLKDTVVLRGIRNVKINAREIVGSQGSKIVVSAPNWTQTFRSVAAGGHGEDGKHGVSGPEGGLTRCKPFERSLV